MTCLIHKDSPTCVKSELDLFLIPPTQTAIEKGAFIEYHPLANKRDGGPVEFNISGSGEDYMDLSASYLNGWYLQYQLGTNLDGTSLAENEPVAPVNLFLHALFGQVDVALNERVVSSSSNTYPYRAYV
ncbi:uncharacterized protein TNCV_2253971 [Trichonephila clavipes]|nr:uncharacterized protein TNCV_2253971 [Trichonephila clavipes]